MTAGDVLARSAVLLRSPLPHPWARCECALGPYCLRCACAQAKFELDEEAGLELSITEYLSGRIFESDGPLVDAVRFVRAAEDAGAIDRTSPLLEWEAGAVLDAARRSFVSQNPGPLENLLR